MGALQLEGRHIVLRQMTRHDAAALLAAANGELWNLEFTVVPDAASINSHIDTALRNEGIMPDGRKRTSVRFSVIDTAWPAVKASLDTRLSRQPA